MPPTPLRLAVLAGGSGTRFWPAGRRSRPKQVLALDGDDPRSLLALTVNRTGPLSEAPPWMIAPSSLLPMLRKILPELGKESFVGEPRPRNTAAAVVLAALVGRAEAPDAVILALPADHHVRPVGKYRQALKAMAARAARTDAILTLGIQPDRPATGYGYLKLGEVTEARGARQIRKVLRFLEKPKAAKAKRLASDGHHLWNGGTFAFRPEVLLREAHRHLPEVTEPLESAFERYGTRGFPAALRSAYDAIPSISVDYGIMERTKHVEAVPADFEWDDLGSWDAVARHRKPDRRGNAVCGAVTIVDADGCVVDAQDGHVALLGVKDLIVVRTKDTVLVARRGRGEDVRDVVKRLEEEGREDLLA